MTNPAIRIAGFRHILTNQLTNHEYLYAFLLFTLKLERISLCFSVLSASDSGHANLNQSNKPINILILYPYCDSVAEDFYF